MLRARMFGTRAIPDASRMVDTARSGPTAVQARQPRRFSTNYQRA
jgi:hypothetical protein